MNKDDIFTFASEKRTPVDPEDLEASMQEGKTMKIRLSELRRIIRETVLREMAGPPPGFIPPAFPSTSGRACTPTRGSPSTTGARATCLT